MESDGPVLGVVRDARRRAVMLAALGNEERLSMLGLLHWSGSGPVPFSEFHHNRPGRRQRVAYHFDVLAKAGLVCIGAQGRGSVAYLYRREADRLLPGVLDAILPHYLP